MITKEKIKFISSLQQKKYRDLHQSFVVEGEKVVNEVLNSDFVGMEVLATSQWIPAKEFDGELTRISEKELSRISGLKSPNKVLAVVCQKEVEEKVEIDQEEFVLMLDGINDPGNLGTIIRTADWFGISQVICSTDCCDVYNPKVVQATMGSMTRVQVEYHNLAVILNELVQEIEVYGTLLNGEDARNIEIEKKGGVLMIGSESQGISTELLPFIPQNVRK